MALLSPENKNLISTDSVVSPALLYTLAKYTVKGDTLSGEQVLWKSSKQIQSPRVAPNSESVVVVNDTRNLYLLAPGAEPRLLAEGSSRYPDWSSDGKYVYFFLESGDKAPDTVSRVDVSATLGETKSAAEKVVNLKYYKDARLRCLPDGSLLLATADATSKTKPDVFGRKTIYVQSVHRLAPGSTKLVQVGASDEFVNKCGYCSFETSPDSGKVVLATENGSIRVLPLPSGSAKEVSPDNNNPSPFAPTFRTNDDLCYASGAANPDSRDVVLQNLKTSTKTIISTSWPGSAVTGVLSKEKAQQNRFEDFLNSLYQ